MKKTLLLSIAALLLVTAVAFAGGAGEKPGAGKIRVAVSLPPANNAWQAKLLDSVLEETAKDTDKFEFTVKNAVDDADQLNMLQTFKDGGYDMIMILPNNGTLMTPICEEIYDADIPTFIIDRAIEGDKYTVLLMGDNYQCGVNAAHYIGKRLDGKGDIAILRSYVGIPIDVQRYNGFMDTIKEYPGIKVLVEGDGEFNQQAGLNAMTNILPAYPKIDAVYCQDDEAVVGAITAIENANRKDIQFLTGYGGSKTAYKLLQEKNPLFGASMSYWPTMGGDSIRVAKKMLLENYKPPKDIIQPTYVVTSENVNQYLDNAY